MTTTTTTTLFLLITISTHLLPTSPKTFPGDIQALRLFKASITPSSIPPSSCLASWHFISTSDPCGSLFSATLFTCGFRCDLTTTVNATTLSRVTDLTLDPAGYSGTLSPSLWSLTALRTLDLPDNLISGHIPPPPPSSAPLLRRITLSRNSLSGPIPSSLLLLPSLEELFLDNNHLTGPLPTNPHTLKRLELQMNNLSGELPTNMQTLQALVFLDLSDNVITGTLPPSLPASLVELSMRNNMLDGQIPSSFGSSPYLQVVDLSHNRLSGKVPGTLFGHQSLEQLVLAGNKLGSLEPPAWGSRSELVAVDLSGNEVTGMLPAWLAGLPRLSALSLEGNRLTGMIPWMYAAREFSRLLLDGNYLYGPIPSPLTTVKEGTARVSLADNCLLRCPEVFFFCHGKEQKGVDECREFNPFIPLPAVTGPAGNGVVAGGGRDRGRVGVIALGSLWFVGVFLWWL